MTEKEAEEIREYLLDEVDRLSDGIRKIEESALYESVRKTAGDL